MAKYCKTFNFSLISNRGDAHGEMVIIVGNEHGDTSSNPGRDW